VDVDGGGGGGPAPIRAAMTLLNKLEVHFGSHRILMGERE